MYYKEVDKKARPFMVVSTLMNSAWVVSSALTLPDRRHDDHLIDTELDCIEPLPSDKDNNANPKSKVVDISV